MVIVFPVLAYIVLGFARAGWLPIRGMHMYVALIMGGRRTNPMVTTRHQIVFSNVPSLGSGPALTFWPSVFVTTAQGDPALSGRGAVGG